MSGSGYDKATNREIVNSEKILVITASIFFGKMFTLIFKVCIIGIALIFKALF